MTFKLHGKQLLQSDECYTDVTALLRPAATLHYWCTNMHTCASHAWLHLQSLSLSFPISPSLSHTDTPAQLDWRWILWTGNLSIQSTLHGYFYFIHLSQFKNNKKKLQVRRIKTQSLAIKKKLFWRGKKMRIYCWSSWFKLLLSPDFITYSLN